MKGYIHYTTKLFSVECVCAWKNACWLCTCCVSSRRHDPWLYVVYKVWRCEIVCGRICVGLRAMGIIALRCVALSLSLSWEIRALLVHEYLKYFFKYKSKSTTFSSINQKAPQEEKNCALLLRRGNCVVDIIKGRGVGAPWTIIQWESFASKWNITLGTLAQRTRQRSHTLFTTQAPHATLTHPRTRPARTTQTHTFSKIYFSEKSYPGDWFLQAKQDAEGCISILFLLKLLISKNLFLYRRGQMNKWKNKIKK